MIWKVEDDKSRFTFLKYNDGHDTTFHQVLLSQAFKDMLQDEQYRYEQHLLRTWVLLVKPLLVGQWTIASVHVDRPTAQAFHFIKLIWIIWQGTC
jgi:hypothetical protein